MLYGKQNQIQTKVCQFYQPDSQLSKKKSSKKMKQKESLKDQQ
jgi:hypothetical protein